VESANYQIRVNGLTIAHIDVRHALVNGVPCGGWQVAIDDPVLGWITIDDNENLWDKDLSKFVLEVRDTDCHYLPNDGWRRKTVAQLLGLLVDTGVIVRGTL